MSMEVIILMHCNYKLPKLVHNTVKTQIVLIEKDNEKSSTKEIYILAKIMCMAHLLKIDRQCDKMCVFFIK